MQASRDTLKAVRRTAQRARVEIKVLPGRGHDILLGWSREIPLGGAGPT